MDAEIVGLYRGNEVFRVGSSVGDLVRFGEESPLVVAGSGGVVEVDCLVVEPLVKNRDIVGGDYMEYSVVVADSRGVRVQQDMYACRVGADPAGAAFSLDSHIPLVDVGSRLVFPFKIWCRN